MKTINKNGKKGIVVMTNEEYRTLMNAYIDLEARIDCAWDFVSITNCMSDEDLKRIQYEHVKDDLKLVHDDMSIIEKWLDCGIYSYNKEHEKSIFRALKRIARCKYVKHKKEL